MTEINLQYILGLKPKAAIKYLKDKYGATSWDWYDIWQEQHTKVFTVAKCMRADILQEIRDEVLSAMDNGTTFEEFRKNLEPTLKEKGWWGKVTIGDGKGAVETVQLGSVFRLKTIYRTNLQTSYMAGRYTAMVDDLDDFPYWQYVAVMDNRTRPSHAALNDLVFPADDPFWNSFYPPNGWGCRCRVVPTNDDFLSIRGLKLSSSKGKLSQGMQLVSEKTGEMQPVTVYKGTNLAGKQVNVSPDVGWNYNPGKTDFKPDLSKYDKDIQEEFKNEKE